LDDSINDVSVASVKRRMEAARAAGSQWVILEIRTLGGAVISAQDLSTYLKSRDYPVVALVDGRAYSAGAMISMACGQIWMKPGSVIGDCAPIMIREDGGLESLPPTERAKQESPVLADFSDSAQRNGHNVRLAQAMVQLGHHSQGLLEPALRPFPQGPLGQHGKQLPGLGLTALEHRQVVDVGIEGGQELIEFPLEPVAGLLDGQAQGIRAMAADQAIGITAAGKLHHRQLQA
jgi:hypothetical protein